MIKETYGYYRARFADLYESTGKWLGSALFAIPGAAIGFFWLDNIPEAVMGLQDKNSEAEAVQECGEALHGVIAGPEDNVADLPRGVALEFRVDFSNLPPSCRPGNNQNIIDDRRFEFSGIIGSFVVMDDAAGNTVIEYGDDFYANDIAPIIGPGVMLQRTESDGLKNSAAYLLADTVGAISGMGILLGLRRITQLGRGNAVEVDQE